MGPGHWHFAVPARPAVWERYMSSTFGRSIKVTVFGESHASAIGVTIDGLPAGMEIDTAELRAFMKRRAPGQNKYSTPRKEADVPEFICGVIGRENFASSLAAKTSQAVPASGSPAANAEPAANGKATEPAESAETGDMEPEKLYTCGTPVTAIIRNSNTRSKDYSEMADKPRPGHADFTGFVKYGGFGDIRGGGHFSGRLTAPMCIAGGIFIQDLKRRGIEIHAEPVEIAGIRVTDDVSRARALAAIDEARENQDSVGGIIECVVTGVPAGIGDPMFDGIENEIAQAVFGVPAVKGIEFGAGFEAARMKGSEDNDPFYIEGSDKDDSAQGAESSGVAFDPARVKTRANNHGGSLGGISSGMPIVFRAVVKPTPSIAREQDTISYSENKNAKLTVHGRHDPCIVLRAVPVVEAAAAMAVFDLIQANVSNINDIR